MSDRTLCTVDGCNRQARSVRSGLCNLHYARVSRSGRLDLKSAEERFWLQVDRGDDLLACWLWTGRVDRTGYARIWVKPRTVYAHRFAYELVVGEIPEGLTLDHTCFVRHCVNPGHLEPVTIQENARRAHSANASKTHCPRGHELNRVNTNGGRECSICRREQSARHSRMVKTLKRLDIPTGIRSVDDLASWLVVNHPEEVAAAMAAHLEQHHS